MRKALGIFCLLVTATAWLLPFVSSFNFVWNVKDTSYGFDLLISGLYFTCFLAGLLLLCDVWRTRFFVIIVTCLFFAFYQVVNWGFHRDQKYMARCRLNDSTEVMLYARDGGATTSNRVYLELQETKALILVIQRNLKSYESVVSGSVESRGDDLVVDMKHFNGDEFTESIPIDSILPKSQISH